MLLSQKEAKQLVDKILSFSKADECNITIGTSHSGNTRFANNSITTSAEVTRAGGVENSLRNKAW